MTDKKYQVFISSTYTDLVDERKAVEETIIRSGDFPVGMEAFPAADEEQFEFIKTIIDKCDYYILIIAGRYGSRAPDGLSYTEKEYRYAVENGIPVLVMLHGDRGSLSVDRSETDTEQIELLEKFISSVSEGRLRKNWTTVDGLKLVVREALDYAKATKQRPGWVRGGHTSSQETLEKLVQLQEDNETLRAQIEASGAGKPVIENLAGLETPMEFKGRCVRGRNFASSGSWEDFRFDTTFGEIFELISPHLMDPQSESRVNSIMAKTLYRRKNGSVADVENFSTDDEVYQGLKIQLLALSLVVFSFEETAAGDRYLVWQLTPYGEQVMITRRAITENNLAY